MTQSFTIITDRAGTKLAKALVPEGWLTGGDRFEDPANKYRPFIAAARAASPDGSISLLMQTGEEFLEVINGAGLDEKHEEDRIDPYFGLMMRRYLLKDEYIDKIAAALAGGTGPELVTSLEKPLIASRTAETFEEAVNARITARAIEFAGEEPVRSGKTGSDDRDNWSFVLKHVLTSHPLRQYRFERDGKSRILLVAADCFAYDYELKGNGTGALSGLPGGLLGRGTGSYISWGCDSLGAVIADEEKKSEAVKAFFRYAASFSWE